MIAIGDWVEINCPEKPWFHGEVGEVVDVFDILNAMYGMAEVTVSKTPGFPITRWLLTHLKPLPDRTVEILGEDYFD